MNIEVAEQTVYIVDDDAAVRDALSFLMDSVDLPAQAFASGQDFLSKYDSRPGVLVLDVRMPGMSGLELQEELVTRGYKDLAVVFISGHGDIPMAVEALKRGATDFLPKPFRDQELLDRIHQALESNQAELEQAIEADEIERRVNSLTPREREVMEMIADGKANKVVAFDLGISQRTVEIHRARVMVKMGVRTLAHLVRALDTMKHFER